MDSFGDLSSNSPTKENESPFDSSSDTKRSNSPLASPSVGVPPSRSPLSWQRRPGSQTGERPKSRPLSVFAAENAASRSSPQPSEPPASATEDAPSRDEIAQSLAGKDPSWFRQTADRGQSSAAYRRSQVEDQETSDMSSSRTQLPGMTGMARDTPAEPPKESSIPRPASPNVSGKLGAALPIFSGQRLDPPASAANGEGESLPADRSSIALSPGRTSPTRPISPTKGIGGFVQSAMMKRSDSVKRWSVNSPGLHRADSAANRNSVDLSQRPKTPGTGSRPVSMLRGDYSTLTESKSDQDKDETDEKPKVAEEKPTAEVKDEADKTTPPTSPSKTMDPRRWSPTKSSSWLEAALNKPESPKPKPSAPASNQPAWMVELNKAKAQKATTASVDLGRSPSLPIKKPEIKTGGLMRPPPMGTNVKPTGLGVFPGGPAADKPVDFRSNLVRRGSENPDRSFPTRRGSENPEAERPVTADGPAAGAKDKPETPPKKDFRANLKPRAPPPETNPSGSGADELKNVFGKLRRTKTQNYVAPDELKNNILRGKAALNNTDGPQKGERKDEFKEALLKKKEDFKKAQQEGRGIARGLSSASTASEKSLPEGIAKRLEMQRTGSTSKAADRTFSDSSQASSPSVTSPPLGSRFGSKFEKETTTTSEKPSTLQKEVSAPGRLQSKVSAGGLGDRFNPALAGLLARGPPPMASGPSSGPGAASSGASEEPTKPGPQLTHMTKNRARGPKRKAPTSVAKPAEEPQETVAETTLSPSKEPVIAAKFDKPVTAPKPDVGVVADFRRSLQGRSQAAGSVISLVDSSKKTPEDAPAGVGEPVAIVDPAPLPIRTRPRSPTKVQEQIAAFGEMVPVRTRSRSPTKVGEQLVDPPASPIRTRPRSPTKVHEQVAALAALSQQSPKPAEQNADPISQPSSPKKLDLKRMSRFLDDSSQPEPKPEPEKTRAPSPTKGRTFPDLASPSMNQSGGDFDGKVDSEPVVSVKAGSAFFGGANVGLTQANIPSRTETTTTSAPADGLVSKPALTTTPTSTPAPAPEPATTTVPVRSPPASEPSPKPFIKPVLRPIPVAAPAAPSPTPAPAPPLAPAPTPFTRPVLKPINVSTPASLAPTSTAVSGSEQAPRLPPKSPRELPAPPPPVPAKDPSRAVAAAASMAMKPSRTRSLSKHTLQASEILNGFFGPHRPKRKYTADAQEVLTRRPAFSSRIQTQKAQLFQLSAEGKKMPVPAHYERTLFEREMYLCPHVYINEQGRKVNEVYLWAGDEVPEAIVDDAYLFAAREARAFGGRLVKMVQGKETSEFLQALGGVVIIRRGSSNKYDSLADNMLCGRRFMGQVAFDEVDFSPASLCSGFPYLITRQGKCYLWKGKGSDVDELGCARLVGMETALMGELVEVEEGKETDAFWELFGTEGAVRVQSADHWKLKPSYSKYSGRLFCSDPGDKEQIIELFPFKQTDLLPTNIYVLDAFFELYIIVGARSQHQYAAFHNALDFAQEYSILAAGMEDRPFVPISTVVLEGIPRDLKSVFRKWTDKRSPTIMHPPSNRSNGMTTSNVNGPTNETAAPGTATTSPTKPGGLRRGRSLRIVPLTQALQALSD